MYAQKNNQSIYSKEVNQNWNMRKLCKLSWLMNQQQTQMIYPLIIMIKNIKNGYLSIVIPLLIFTRYKKRRS